MEAYNLIDAFRENMIDRLCGFIVTIMSVPKENPMVLEIHHYFDLASIQMTPDIIEMTGNGEFFQLIIKPGQHSSRTRKKAPGDNILHEQPGLSLLSYNIDV